jgi:two-component system response regulator AtoC
MSELVLVVDDDRSMRTFLSDFLTSQGYVTDCAASGEEAIARLKSGHRPAAVILDLPMPGVGGLEVLGQMLLLGQAPPVIVMSGVRATKTVVEAMQMGASDYLVKPFEEDELSLALADVLNKPPLRSEVTNWRRSAGQFNARSPMASQNPKMQRVIEIASQVAEADVPVLILGESGVGKEVIAHLIHERSGRSDQPFVKVNCAAIPHDLLESELFGYERGAFTGAIQKKLGHFELANRGTILLDEIGDMSPALQAKLLHIVQDGEYTRLGGRKSVRAQARVMATTNKNLTEAVAAGTFREDLHFRLSVIRLEVPPLRERREDIPALCKHFMARYREQYHSTVQELPPELLEAGLRHDWPGNVRELENTVKRYLILPDLDLALSELHRAERSFARNHPVSVSSDGVALPWGGTSLKELAAQAAETVEREAVLRALESNGWNRKQAARELNICYKALLNKLKRWQINRPLVDRPNTPPSRQRQNPLFLPLERAAG